MMNRMKSLMRSEEGQGMTEYIIIVALIAIAAIGIITVFGQNLRALFGASAGVLAGEENAKPADFGGKTSAESKTGRRTLSDFGNTKAQ